MQFFNEDVHNLILVDPYKNVKKPTSIETERSSNAPKMPKLSRAQTAPPRPSADKVGLPETQRFLRKNQAAKRPTTVVDKTDHICRNFENRRPPVPKPSSPQPVRISKNFVLENMKKVEKMEAKKPLPYVVVSCRGERQNMNPMLEARKIVESDSFGRVPKYLARKKLAWQREHMKETIKEAVREDQDCEETRKTSRPTASFDGFEQVSEEQRHHLLQGLKDRWKEIHKEYLVLPVLCETIPKIKRKLQLEQRLGELEKDIELLERNPYIYLEHRKNNP